MTPSTSITYARCSFYLTRINSQIGKLWMSIVSNEVTIGSTSAAQARSIIALHEQLNTKKPKVAIFRKDFSAFGQDPNSKSSFQASADLRPGVPWNWPKVELSEKGAALSSMFVLPILRMATVCTSKDEERADTVDKGRKSTTYSSIPPGAFRFFQHVVISMSMLLQGRISSLSKSNLSRQHGWDGPNFLNVVKYGIACRVLRLESVAM